MKTCLPLLFLLLSFQPIFAQDYQIVRSDFVRFFADTAGEHHGIKIDSVQVVGTDSVFYNYLHVRHNRIEPYHATMTAPSASFVGTKIVVKSDGITLFFNENNDTIWIDSQAELNESWNLMVSDSGTSVRATISQVQNESILDSLVQVKTINLQLLDANENNLAHPLNDATIRVSNTLGLIECPDLHLFPNQIEQFAITGMEKPNRGVFRPSCGEYHEHSVGDEYHRWFSQSAYSNSITWRKSTAKVISADIIWPNQIVIYQIIEQRYNNDYPLDTTSLLRFDTVYHDLDFIAPCTGPMPNQYDLFFLPNGPNYLDNEFGINSCGRPFYETFINDNINFGLNPSQGPNFYEGWESVGPNLEGETYVHGLGRTNRYTYHWHGNNTSSNKLVYYKRGDEECGTPYSLDHLLSTSESQSEPFKLYPNPIRQGERIQVQGNQSAQIDVLSVNGQQIPVAFNNRMLQTQNLVSGIYVVRFTSEKGVSTQKLVVTD